MPAPLLEPLVYHLFYLDSTAIVFVMGCLYDSLRGRIKAHQAGRTPGDNVLFSESPRELYEVGHLKVKDDYQDDYDRSSFPPGRSPQGGRKG
jgi:hypothetical protein